MTRHPSRDVRRGDGFIQKRTAKDGSLRYQARWPELQRDRTTAFRSKTFHSLEDAENHLREVGTQRRRGTYIPESELTVVELMDEFIGRTSRRVADSTISTYKQVTRAYIVPYIGRERIATLTPRRAQLWIDDLSKDGFSPSVIASARTLVSSAMSEAVRLGVCRLNPIADVSTPRTQIKAYPTWSVEEAQLVLAAVASDPKWYAFYLCALLTGMRPGELRALQWKDIDGDNGIIHCRRTISRDADGHDRIGETTKGRRVRSIAITSPLADALSSWRHVQRVTRIAHASWHDLDLVFDRGDGRFYSNKQLRLEHMRICEREGVRFITLHGFRHTSATLELLAGTNPKIVQERLGHTSVKMTLDRYSHVSPDIQRSAAEAMSDRLIPLAQRERIDARKIDD